MLDTCPNCQTRVLFTTDFCPRCNKSRVDGTRDPKLAEQPVTAADGDTIQEESGVVGGILAVDRKIRAFFRLIGSLGSTEGRLRRGPFAMKWLMVTVCCTALFFAGMFLSFLLDKGFHLVSGRGLPDSALGILFLVGLLFQITGVVALVPLHITLYIRRLKDLGTSPWLVALYFVPFLNVFLLLALFLFPSSDRGID